MKKIKESYKPNGVHNLSFELDQAGIKSLSIIDLSESENWIKLLSMQSFSQPSNGNNKKGKLICLDENLEEFMNINLERTN